MIAPMLRSTGQAKRPMPPDDDALAKQLGGAKPHWDGLIAAAAEADASCKAEWAYYKSLKGWRCILKGGKRSLVHLRPEEGSFLASFALSDEALAAAERFGVPPVVLAEARAAKMLPEGRPIRLEVNTAKDLRVAVRLVRAKAGAVR